MATKKKVANIKTVSKPVSKKTKSTKKPVLPEITTKLKAKKRTIKKSFKKPILKTEREIALDFAAKVHKKFSTIVKATILFGSQAKDNATPASDIDIIIIVDDASINWDMELVAWYREELAKLIQKNQYASELHINTIRLTTWWHDLMKGDAVIINVLRYGEALIDLGGFFNPIKALLIQGKIHATPESVYAALHRAPKHLARSKYAELGTIEGVYWTMVDSAQAALITLGKLPPSPEHITSMLKVFFVDKKLLKIEYAKWFREIQSLHKNIIHGEIKGIKGSEIDLWQERAEKFMVKMTELIDTFLDAKKE